MEVILKKLRKIFDVLWRLLRRHFSRHAFRVTLTWAEEFPG